MADISLDFLEFDEAFDDGIIVNGDGMDLKEVQEIMKRELEKRK